MATVNIEDLDEGQQDAIVVIAAAELLKVTDTASYEKAAGFRKHVKALIKQVEEFFEPLKRKALESHRTIVAQEKKSLEGPTQALAIVNGAITTYETAQRREQLIAQARAAEEAKQIEASRPAPAPGQPPLLPVVVPARPVEIPKVDGLGFATFYHGHVVDKRALCRAIAEEKVTPDVFDAVQKILDEWARTYGPSTAAAVNPGTQYPMPGVPGVCIVAERKTRG